MEKDFEIVSGKSPLEQYFNANTVSDNAQRKLESVDLLAVPAKYVDGEFYYAQETIDFIKFCRQNDPDHSFDVLADGDVKLRSLHSFDIWLPIIWVAQSLSKRRFFSSLGVLSSIDAAGVPWRGEKIKVNSAS